MGSRRSIFHTASSSVVLRVVSLACTLIQLRMALKYLGDEWFGLWMVLVAIGGFFGLSDMGIAAAFQNDVTLACAQGRKGRLRPMFLTAQLSLLVFAIGIGVLLLAFAAVWGRATFFGKLPAQMAAHAVFYLGIYVAVGGINVPLSLGSRLAFGLHRGYLSNLASVAAQLLTLGCLLVAVRAEVSFALFLLAATLPTALCNLALSAWLYGTLEPAPGPRLESRDYARHAMFSGMSFLALNAGQTLFFSAGPLLLASTLGSAAVTAFSLSTRALGIVHNLEGGVLGALWPSLTTALERQDFAWARRCIFKSIGFTVAFFCLPTLLFPWLGPRLLSLWSGMPAGDFPNWIVWPLTALYVGILFQGPFYIALSAGGSVGLLAASHFGAAGAVFVMSVLWSSSPELLPAFLAIGYLLFAVVPPMVQSARIYRLWPRV